MSYSSAWEDHYPKTFVVFSCSHYIYLVTTHKW